MVIRGCEKVSRIPLQGDMYSANLVDTSIVQFLDTQHMFFDLDLQVCDDEE